MKIDTLHRGEYKNHEEEKQERYRSEVADATRERSGLKFLRQCDADAIAGEQIVILPVEVPAFPFGRLGRRGQRVFQNIEILEIGMGLKLEVLHFSDAFAKI